MSSDLVVITLDFLKAIVGSAAFVLVLFIGFCVLLGFAKLKKTAGRDLVVRSLDEALSHKPMEFLPPTAPHGPVDQLRGARA